MTVYFLTILFTAVFGIIASNRRMVRILQNGKEEYYTKSIIILFILATWVAVFACRGISVGADTSGYIYYFNDIIPSAISLTEFLSNQRDRLFGFLEYLCCRMFHGSWICFQIIVAILTYAPILKVLKNKADYLTSSLLLFFFTTSFFCGFNGMRQAIAMSISFYAYYTYFLEKKYIRYAFLLLIALGFHSSVLFVIPIHILSKFEIKGGVIKFAVIFILILFLFIWQIWPFIINFLESIGQIKMATDYAVVAKNEGSSFLRFIVAFVPVGIGYIYKEKLEEQFSNVNNELILCLFGALFMLLSIRFWIFARVAAYFLLSQILFIPKLYNVFSKDSQKVGGAIILLLYFAYMVLLLIHGEGDYYPYYFIF